MPGEQILYQRPLPGARLNMAHPLALGLIGCWLLNENGGLRAMDLSPYGNHGILQGPIRAFNGMLFDGVDDYVNLGSPAILGGMSTLTVGAWIKPAAYPPAADVARIFHRAEGGNPNRILMDINENGYLRLTINNSGNIQTTDAVPLSSYSLATGIYNRGNIDVYINHLKQATGSIADQAITAGNIGVRIGYDVADARPFNGSIAGVWIWSRVLSPEDIKSLYLSPYKPMGLPMFI